MTKIGLTHEIPDSPIAGQPDMTLAELQARLSAEHGVHFAIGTLWRFFKRRRITFKKRRRMLPSSNART